MNFGEDAPASPASTRGEFVAEEQRPLTPAPEDELQDAPRRKSGTFWRRKSSLSLGNAFLGINGKENQPQNTGLNGGSPGPMGGNAVEGQNSLTNGRHGAEEDTAEEDTAMEDLDTEKEWPELEEPLPPRSYSPPPQLPEFVGGGVGLGGADLFKDIH